VEVEGVIAGAPRDSAFFVRSLVGLAIYAWLMNQGLADSAHVYIEFPGPKCHCIPLFHFKCSFLRLHHLIKLIIMKRDFVQENPRNTSRKFENEIIDKSLKKKI